jgi:hypothetical protein
MKMKTYVEVMVSTEGEKASIITDLLFNIGFKTTFGQHDFVYNWKQNVTLPEVLKFIDTVQKKLNGTKALLKFSTID